MHCKHRWMAFAAMALTLVGLGAAVPAAAACDRACLGAQTDALLMAMVAHDPLRLPLTVPFRATENGVASGLGMTNAFSTVTDVVATYRVLDPVSQQAFFIAEVKEGARSALLFGRLRLRDERIAELETYLDRSAHDTGYMFGAASVGHLPDNWTVQVDAARVAPRAQLLAWGQSIFNPALPAPPDDPSCRLMENGKIVEEYADVADLVASDAKADAGHAPQIVTIPCGNLPERPADAQARTDIVDEVQGVVVSIATVHGMVEPSYSTQPTISAFVPDSLLAPYLQMVQNWHKDGKDNVPAVTPMRASIAVAELHRYYDGKLQGMHMVQHLGPPGFHSPWVD